jgi:uncharacterized protein YgiM (DUF1202 family)
MQLRIHSLMCFVFVCLVSLVQVSFAEPNLAMTEEPVATVESNEVYLGQITGDEVNIRSGPGTNYYICQKLNNGDRVKVLGGQFGWSRIEPPTSSFSWVSKQYVNIDPNRPALGVVTGEAVRVYAGADDRKPMHSTTLQGKLNKGDSVKLLGGEQDDYYKIVPPEFAYLWISTKYVKWIGHASGEVPMIVESNDANAVGGVITEVPLVDIKLKEYYELQEKVKAERIKPIVDQNYAEIKTAFQKLANDKEAGKAARYAEYAIKQVERCELAKQVDGAAKLQDQQLQQTGERIEKARAANMAKVQAQDMGRFAAVGKFQVSSIYTEPDRKHYQLIDNGGRIICFALPDGPASNIDLDQFIGKNVGLVGTIEPHQQTAGALVRFTEIAELNQ